MNRQELLLALMNWKLPPGTAEAVAKLDALEDEVASLVGRENLPETGTEPQVRREQLIDLVEGTYE